MAPSIDNVPPQATTAAAAVPTTTPDAPKRAVFVLFEGTGNEFRNESYTNVVRMLRLLRKDDEERQLVYYGEGLGRHNFNTGGTLSGGTKMTIAAQALSMGLGSAIAEHILDAYRWLMNVHRKGDEVYVMGFSRGSYAAGCFCGLLESIGLLPRENTQMIATGWDIYAEYSKDVTLETTWEAARSFRTSFSKLVRIHFLGMWDCVASIGTGNEAPYAFPQHRGTVQHVYHAMALDEGRNRFSVLRFSDHFSNYPPLYRAVHSSQADFKREIELAKALKTDIHEVWFPGNHTDVGGGGHNDVLLKEAVTQSQWLVGDDLVIETEKRVPHPALGFLSLRWMLRALLQAKSREIDILLDPLMAAIFDLELSYGLQRDTTSVDQNVWPAEHLAYLRSTSSAEDRERATVAHRDVLDAPKIEIELATLKLRSAFGYEPGSGFSGWAMSKYWGVREVADWTVGEEATGRHPR
ncbi:hypothetical protein FA10DRAFT_290332 [Acaromyces ingoldii]|uniref:T6SS Phospholipase effector Tle1-like catalytic domain-containing protein n=1 Tax=Acaromyces ingoldii TaxID=215250 RepID=A0A316YW03_9BASI|nr:hypothetical protein FA10DRAFT_290332 [Acaromyces ingoldii]PWN93216.1 hypothetical protein FA10DRAFT_290332 [Acaromyces ingoldii]